MKFYVINNFFPPQQNSFICVRSVFDCNCLNFVCCVSHVDLNGITNLKTPPYH